jgi:hypothetical protein
MIVTMRMPRLKLVARGKVDGSMLEALEDDVKRQKQRLGSQPAMKEAANWGCLAIQARPIKSRRKAHTCKRIQVGTIQF